MIINGYFIGFAGRSDRDIAGKYWRLAQTIGEEIMKRGHRLVSGGCAGGVTQFCAEKASNFLNNKIEEEHRIISILWDDKIEPHSTFIEQGNKFVCQGKGRVERRLFMASLMDSLITIEGTGGTKAEIDACLDVGTPVIPIWTTGGASGECWNHIIKPKLNNNDLPPYCFYKGNVISKIDALGKLDINSKQNEIGKIAVDIAIELAKKKIKYPCTLMPTTNNKVFVIMPFSEEFDEVYSSIKEIFEKGIYKLPVQFDECKRHEAFKGEIPTSVYKCIDNVSLLIVDLTGYNRNVMHEYGYAIGVGLGKKTILINQSPKKSMTKAIDVASNIQIKYELSNLEKLKENLINAIKEFYK